tara:strand:+ start:8999 stop:9757 length:759 start_codon:yes stop_codon:yes gene_type:complete
MKKYKLTAILISSALATGNVMANEDGSINKQLSSVRTDISVQILQNKLYDAELEGLKKQKQIKDLKDTLIDVDTKTIAPNVKTDRDLSLKFNETLNEEDILSENNDWEQNVGFIYQDDIGFEGGNDDLSSLTASDNSEDFSDLLNETLDELSEENQEIEASSVSNVQSSSFNLVSVELSKLTVFEDQKNAEVKVNYLTNNGYQTIKGAKYSKVTVGKVFDVKGNVSFEVMDISENGVKLKNLNTEKVTFITK